MKDLKEEIPNEVIFKDSNTFLDEFHRIMDHMDNLVFVEQDYSLLKEVEGYVVNILLYPEGVQEQFSSLQEEFEKDSTYEHISEYARILESFIKLHIVTAIGEIEHYSVNPEKLEEGALTQLDRAEAYYTCEAERPSKVLSCFSEMGTISMIKDFRKTLKSSIKAYLKRLEGYPHHQKRIHDAIEIIAAKYPKGFVAISDNRVPIKAPNPRAEEETYPRGKFLQKTAHGALYEFVGLPGDKFTEEKDPSTIPQVSLIKRKENIEYPLAKYSDLVFSDKISPNKAYPVSMGKSGEEKIISSFLLEIEQTEGVQISRSLDSYDKRVFVALSNLAKAGATVTTAAQIYKEMGNLKKPNDQDTMKVISSLKQMMKVIVTIDNRKEAEKYNYPRIKDTFPLLPIRISEAIYRGQTVDNGVFISEVPYLFTISEERKQLGSFSRALLNSPLSQTKNNLTLEDYLLRRILKIKRKAGNQSPTIILSTLFNKCDIDSKNRKEVARAREKIERLLDYYVKEKWFFKYEITDKAIKITLEEPKKRKPKE